MLFFLGFALRVAAQSGQPDIPVLMEPDAIEGRPPPITHEWVPDSAGASPIDGILNSAEEGLAAVDAPQQDVEVAAEGSSVWASSVDVTPQEARTIADNLKGLWRDLQMADETMIVHEEGIASYIHRLREAGIEIEKVGDAIEGQQKLYNAGASVLNQLLLSTQDVHGTLSLGASVEQTLRGGVGQFDDQMKLGEAATQQSEEELAALTKDVNQRADTMLGTINQLYMWSDSATGSLNAHAHMLVDLTTRLQNISDGVNFAEERLLKLVSSVGKHSTDPVAPLPGTAAVVALALFFA